MIYHARPSTAPNRRSNQNPLDRREYQLSAMHLAKKGVQLKHAKLTPDQVITIRSTVKQRLSLLQYIRDNLSNEAMTKQYGVSENTLTRVVQFKAYGHIV